MDADPRPPPSAWRVAWMWAVPLMVLVGFRSAVAAPFHVPSGSMAPTIEVRDLIVVNKLSYGLNVPWIRSDGSPGLGRISTREVLSWSNPQRGDVILFRYPPDPSQDFVKRVIGLPGDRVAVRDGQVWINDAPIPRHVDGPHLFEDAACGRWPTRRVVEDFGERAVGVLEDPTRHTDPHGPTVVPEGTLFVLGDNRDHSADSRFWGVVPRDHVRGRAAGVWLRRGCDGDVSVKWRRL